MAKHIIFHNCSTELKPKVRNHWQKKQRRIEKLLTTFPEDQRHLRLSVKKEKRGWQAQAVLSLPTGTLVARTEPYLQNYQQALEIVTDKLVDEIRRHKEKLRRDALYRRKNRQQRDFATVVPLLTQDREQNDRANFFELLRPVLKNLRNHAQREIVFAQVEGKLKPGELTVSELFDETIVRAWEGFNQKMPERPLEWLSQILHSILDEYERKTIPTVSLEEVIPLEDPRYEGITGWIQENEPFWGEQETLTLEDLLPGYEATEPWYQLTFAEQERWLLRCLNNLSPEQRKAFVLYSLEGWSEDEIAMLQERSLKTVGNDIKAARQYLEEQLQQTFSSSNF